MDVHSTMTAEEFADQNPNHRVELVDGKVVELPRPEFRAGLLLSELNLSIGNHAERLDLGWVTTGDSFVVTRSDPDCVRGADLCFFSWDRLPRGRFPSGLVPNIPDLILEIEPSHEESPAIQAKVREYLEAGVRVVGIVDLDRFSITLYRSAQITQVLDNGDTLTIPDVFPGYAVKVKSLFAGLYPSEAPAGQAG